MSILILLIQQVFIIGLISHLWFNTDVVHAYLRLCSSILPQSISTFLMINEYSDRDIPEIDMTYIDYLSTKYYFHTNKLLKFTLKLLSCPTCFTLWLCIIAVLICNIFLYIGVVFFFSRLVDFFLKFFLKLQ
jgi:hypothetical protein